MDMNKMDQLKVDDLKLPPDVFAVRLQRRAELAEDHRRAHGGDQCRPSQTRISTSTTSRP